MEAAVLQQQLQYLRSDLQIAPMQHTSILFAAASTLINHILGGFRTS
jgi:hypothetical protein